MSFHLALCGRRKIAIGSDSRGMLSDGSHVDTLRKSFQAGKRTVCGILGVSRLGPEIYVADRISALCALTSLQDSPRELLEAIRDDLAPSLTAIFAERPVPRGSSAVFSAFVIRRHHEGKVDLLELSFPVIVHGTARTMGDPVVKTQMADTVPRGVFAYTHGNQAPPNKLHERLDPDRLSDEAVLSAMDDFFAACESAYGSVGGPIDVCEIEQSVGFRWVRKKEP